ncbi:hypothetical protein F3Y22_tig00112253pilonHSYRG00101 [Hibiscus syriacus]|uniref:Uncharacterized protein n=1 Tax=Hibiscus syriacus TaxID=106335 RepID=A0A6A2XQJ8_HIBSY|nr:hypothetical protein F3Y22_tig00112253pilonHSYRG00101 [Hibiscus syriacus]
MWVLIMSVNEEEKTTAVCDGECDKVNCLSFSLSSSSSSNLASPPCPCSSSSIYLELWHGCVCPLTSLPKIRNLVVYFPQGHLERVASVSPLELSTFDLLPQIFCKW